MDTSKIPSVAAKPQILIHENVQSQDLNQESILPSKTDYGVIQTAVRGNISSMIGLSEELELDRADILAVELSRRSC